MVLWGSGVPIEPKHEIDSGMMPPPATLPLGVGRRPSTSNSAIITAAAAVAAAANAAAGVTTDQIQSSSIGLKTEIIDENSQNSTSDAMHTDTSLDQFPSTVSNDAAVAVAAAAVAAAAVSVTSPIERIRKQSIDIIDMHSMSLMNDANSLSNFPTAAATMHAVKQEEINSQLQSQILSVAAAAQAAQAAAAAQTAQDQQTVNKFLSSLDSNMTDLKSTVTVDNNSVNSLFGNAPTNTPNSNAIFSQPPSINNIEMMSATTPTNLESTFSQSILSNNNPSPTMNQILSMSQTDSPKAVRSPSSSSSSSTSIHSPVTQDIILNSEPAASIQSGNIQMMQSSQCTSQTEHITSELILNPTVSPSMMCPPSTDPNNLIVNQVTIANTILNEMNLAAVASQNSQDQILNSMMLNSHPSEPSNQMNHTSHKNTSAVTTVNNMILKAAADFITNQERNSISTESTLNALMSLNSTPILNDSQSTVSQILNQLPSNPSQTTSASSSVLTRNEPSQPPPSSSQTRLDIMQPPQPMQTQTTLSRHISPSTHFNEQNVMSNTTAGVNMNSLSTVTLNNLLMNQDVTRTATTQNDFLQNLQKTATVS